MRHREKKVEGGKERGAGGMEGRGEERRVVDEGMREKKKTEGKRNTFGGACSQTCLCGVAFPQFLSL